MSKSDHIPDEPRWAIFFRQAREPVFILNRRRRIVFANSAWEFATSTSVADAKSLTCTMRDTGHSHASLGAALAPPNEVLAGQTMSVRRSMPGRDSGPPWWDIDFVPIMGAGEAIAVLGRIRQPAPAPAPPKSPMPAVWASLRHEVQQRYSLTQWESANAEIRRVVAQARLVASTACHAILVGEQGTGKQSLARTIHSMSARRELPCICLACDRLPVEAIRRTIQNRSETIGLVYLSAPAALPREFQVEVARALFDRCQVFIGSVTDPTREGQLVEELWVTASTMTITIPQLRERIADLPRLIDAMLPRVAPATERQVASVTPAALEKLGKHSWPGNLDELEYVIRTASMRCNPPAIDVADLPLAMREPAEPIDVRVKLPPLDRLLEQVESRLIRLALDRAKGNKTKAAELLGIWRPRLVRRIETQDTGDPGE